MVLLGTLCSGQDLRRKKSYGKGYFSEKKKKKKKDAMFFFFFLLTNNIGLFLFRGMISSPAAFLFVAG